jgi:ribonuclease BN (tRNA processing enzyme)
MEGMMPTPQEVERARECALLVLECCADLYEHGRKSTHPSTMADAIESATQKILAYHAHASVEEAEKVRRLVEAVKKLRNATALVHWAGNYCLTTLSALDEIDAAMDALKEEK